MSTVRCLRQLLQVAMLLTIGCATVRGEPSPESKVRHQMTGLWRGYVVEGRGEKPNQGPVHLELTITTETITGQKLGKGQPEDLGQGRYAVKLDTKRQHMDGLPIVERGNRKPWLGIFELRNDTLKWCVSRSERPSEFITRKGQFPLILRRVRKRN